MTLKFKGETLKKSYLYLFIFSVTLCALLFGFAQDTSASLYKDATQPTEARVADLLAQMTLKEKVGQMTQIDVARIMGDGPWDRGPLSEDWLKIVFEKNQVGSILSGGGAAPIPNTPQAWAEMTNQLQEAALNYSRLGIPMIYGIDAVHGHNNVLGASIYPHNIGLAATWNPDLIEAISARVAKDVRAVGNHWTFAPVADVARDPRWGRFYESFGEDSLLTSELVAANVTGFQSSGEVAATVKHFGAYGQPLVGFDRSPAFIDLRSLRSLHFPSFQAGIDAGALGLMVNSGSINGVPVHASSYMIQELARNELGFNGLIISDWEDILKLVTVHKTAKDFKEAVAMSINAGIDMYMVPHDADTFTTTLISLVEEGTVAEARIDEAVSKILSMKFDLGLFETPFTDAAAANNIVIEEERSLAKQAALESITLLENAKVLPFTQDTQSIFVTGSSADSIANQMGGWTIGWQGMGDSQDVPPGLSFIDAFEQAAPEGTSITYTSQYGNTATVLEKANDADVAVVVLGETPYAEGEGDNNVLTLPDEQVQLMRSILETDTPLVVILLAGRPLMLPEDIWLGLDALIMAYLPGSETGTALSDVLFGNYNPSGKLPFSWPRHVGQLPITYDGLAGTPYDPLYEFGFGRSYSKFNQRNLSLSLNNDSITASIDVENASSIAGHHVVQVFVTYPAVGIMTPERKLVGFTKAYFEPNEVKTLSVDIPLSRLALIPGDILGTAEATVFSGTYTFSVDRASKTLELP